MENFHSINELRDKFLKTHQNKPELFDDQDVDRVLSNDFTIQRYLLHNSMDESKAYEMLIESMKWRKEFGVNYLMDNHFPKEFYKFGVIFPYSVDKQGFKTMFIRIKMIKKVPELKNHYKKFLVHNINKVDLEANGKGWVLVVDAQGAGLSNCEVDLLIFLISTLNNHFPGAIQYILINSLPFALRGIWKVATAFIPSERMDLIRFSTSQDITQYISLESLPDFLSGSSPINYREEPFDSPDALEFGTKTLGLPIDRVLKIVDSYEKLLKNA